MTIRLNPPKRVSFVIAIVLWIIGLAGAVLELGFIPEPVGVIAFLAATVLLVIAMLFPGI